LTRSKTPFWAFISSVRYGVAFSEPCSNCPMIIAISVNEPENASHQTPPAGPASSAFCILHFAFCILHSALRPMLPAPTPTRRANPLPKATSSFQLISANFWQNFSASVFSACSCSSSLVGLHALSKPDDPPSHGLRRDRRHGNEPPPSLKLRRTRRGKRPFQTHRTSASILPCCPAGRQNHSLSERN